VLGLGVRADLGDALTGASGLAKFALAALLAAVAASGLPRAVEPGRRAPVEGLVVGLVVLLLAGIGWAFRAPEAAFDGDPMGCVLSILGLSILPLVAILVALRPGAATRPGTTGALAGIVAGGIAAFGFGLYCPADLGPYVALWYPVAIVACGVGGALVGRWVLAW